MSELLLPAPYIYLMSVINRWFSAQLRSASPTGAIRPLLHPDAFIQLQEGAFGLLIRQERSWLAEFWAIVDRFRASQSELFIRVGGKTSCWRTVNLLRVSWTWITHSVMTHAHGRKRCCPGYGCSKSAHQHHLHSARVWSQHPRHFVVQRWLPRSVTQRPWKSC